MYYGASCQIQWSLSSMKGTIIGEEEFNIRLAGLLFWDLMLHILVRYSQQQWPEQLHLWDWIQRRDQHFLVTATCSWEILFRQRECWEEADDGVEGQARHPSNVYQNPPHQETPVQYTRISFLASIHKIHLKIAKALAHSKLNANSMTNYRMLPSYTVGLVLIARIY